MFTVECQYSHNNINEIIAKFDQRYDAEMYVERHKDDNEGRLTIGETKNKACLPYWVINTNISFQYQAEATAYADRRASHVEFVGFKDDAPLRSASSKDLQRARTLRLEEQARYIDANPNIENVHDRWHVYEELIISKYVGYRPNEDRDTILDLAWLSRDNRR